MAVEPGLNPDFSVYYGGTHFNFHSMAVECTPENFGSEDRVVFIRETYAITGVLVEFQQGSGGLRQANIHAAFDRVREDLMSRKLRLVIKVGGVTLIDHGAAQDFDGGPTPKSCKITEITGGLAAKIAWTVEIARPFDVDNPHLAAGQDDPWHTYIMTVQVDDRFLSTRTIRGSARRATRMLAGDARWIEKQNPPLRGFKRERKWNVVRDGHQIDYELIDKEIYLAFPKPVTNGKATFQIGRKQVGEGSDATWKTVKHLSAAYEAGKGVPKRQLAAMLVLLATSRFALVDQIYIVTSFSVSEDIFGGGISLEITAEGDSVSQGGFQKELDRTLGKDVPRADGELQDAGPWGTANINPLAGTTPGPISPVIIPAPPSTRNPAADEVNTTKVVGGIKRNWADRGKKVWSLKGGVLGYEWSGFMKPKPKPAAAGAAAAGGAPNLFDVTEAVDGRVTRIYETRRHLAVLKPKGGDVGTIIQETAAPTLTITEIGEARFLDEIPAASETSGVVEEFRRVIPSLPQEDAAGQLVCPVRWIRRMVVA